MAVVGFERESFLSMPQALNFTKKLSQRYNHLLNVSLNPLKTLLNKYYLLLHLSESRVVLIARKTVKPFFQWVFVVVKAVTSVTPLFLRWAFIRVGSVLDSRVSF